MWSDALCDTSHSPLCDQATIRQSIHPGSAGMDGSATKNTSLKHNIVQNYDNIWLS